MNNIFTIFLTDFKRIRSNVVAIIIIMGLVIVPVLYAWFNILSNWDPYGAESTSKIKVAVASDDLGIEIEGIYFNMGDKVIEALESNTTIGWVFPENSDAAIDGVYSGDYYAALVMPSDFSENLVSFLTEESTHPVITYYENEKKNAIAPKITAKAKSAVQLQINETFISTLAEAITKAAGTVMETDEMQEMGITSADNLVDVIIAKLNSLLEQLDTYEAVIDSFLAVSDTATSTIDSVSENNIDSTISYTQSTLSSANRTLTTGLAANLSVAQNVASSLRSMQTLLNAVSDTSEETEENIAAFNENLQTMNTNLVSTRELMEEMRTNLQDTVDDLTALKSSDSYNVLVNLLSSDSDSVGSFMSEPVQIETMRVFPIDNYGSAMAPFYSILAIWVGALFQVAIIHVPVHKIPGVNFTARDAYFGRYITFFLIGQMQALLTALGDLHYIGIQCVDPMKFWFAGAIASLVFTVLIYSLTFAFGNIGEAIAVIVMVIQVAGAGGTFPKEVLPQIYQNVYKFLPFPYAMDAMREAVGGLYENYYWECIGHLLLYIPICIIVGLVGHRLFRKMDHLIEENKEGSGIML